MYMYLDDIASGPVLSVHPPVGGDRTVVFFGYVLIFTSVEIFAVE